MVIFILVYKLIVIKYLLIMTSYKTIVIYYGYLQ